MKAAFLNKIGNFILTDIKKPKCGPNDILIKVKACAICQTDIKMINCGHRDLVLPRILGHEISGIISDLGSNVKNFKVGEKVQIYPGISCGLCKYCINGYQNMCNNISIIGFHHNGGFAEYLILPFKAINSGCINIIPDNLTFEEASLSEPIACCINALEAADFKPGENIIIWGSGFMGLLFIQLFKAYGASKVIAVDKNNERFAASKKFGADHFVNSAYEDVFQEIEEFLIGDGADLIIIACSNIEEPNRIIKLLSKRGRIVFFSGIKESENNIFIDHNLIHYKELKIVGSYGCTSRQNVLALHLLSTGKIKVKDLIAHCINIDQIEYGIKMALDSKGMKVIVNY